MPNVVGKKTAVPIRSQVKVRRVLHEALLLPVLLYGSETKIWKEKEF